MDAFFEQALVLETKGIIDSNGQIGFDHISIEVLVLKHSSSYGFRYKNYNQGIKGRKRGNKWRFKQL